MTTITADLLKSFSDAIKETQSEIVILQNELIEKNKKLCKCGYNLNEGVEGNKFSSNICCKCGRHYYDQD